MGSRRRFTRDYMRRFVYLDAVGSQFVQDRTDQSRFQRQSHVRAVVKSQSNSSRDFGQRKPNDLRLRDHQVSDSDVTDSVSFVFCKRRNYS